MMTHLIHNCPWEKHLKDLEAPAGYYYQVDEVWECETCRTRWHITGTPNSLTATRTRRAARWPWYLFAFVLAVVWTYYLAVGS